MTTVQWVLFDVTGKGRIRPGGMEGWRDGGWRMEDVEQSKLMVLEECKEKGNPGGQRTDASWVRLERARLAGWKHGHVPRSVRAQSATTLRGTT